MGTHLRLTPVLALIGALAFGAAPTAQAQDTSSAVRADTSARSDTSGYQGYGSDTLQRSQPTGQADSGAKYNGPPTDTTLKAKPGVQTGPSAADSSSTGQTSSSGQANTVVCKDGSTSPRTGQVCLNHGGIDWTSTNAALKARGQAPIQPGDSASADTALRAKPGVQTGPTDSSAMGRMNDSTGMGQMNDSTNH
ncbi:MAG TPA: hypothetical protein VJQ44_15875 [Gemmatimonadales bacterium]|nr:hypothetical protein [Gemmatimonadales bacterium]